MNAPQQTMERRPSAGAYVIEQLIETPGMLSTELADRRPKYMADSTVPSRLGWLLDVGVLRREKVIIDGHINHRYYIDDLTLLPEGMREKFTDQPARISRRGHSGHRAYKGETMKSGDLFEGDMYAAMAAAITADEVKGWIDVITSTDPTEQVFRQACWDNGDPEWPPLNPILAENPGVALGELHRVDIVTEEPTIVVMLEGGVVSFTARKARALFTQLGLVFAG